MANRGFYDDPQSDTNSNYGGGNALQNYLSSFGTKNGAGILRERDQQEMGLFKAKMAAKLSTDRGALSPGGFINDYSSEYASGRDNYLVANAMGVRPYKPSETPQLKNNDLTNYLNWVPNKEKMNLATIQNQKRSMVNRLSPLRAGPGSVFTEDDRRSQMSKTVLKVRDKFSYSQAGDDLQEISVDGISISAQKPKPRALSNLRTINGYGGTGKNIDLSSLYIKKNNTPGILSPAPKRGILDELPWEDRHKVMNFSMAKINSLNKDDLMKVINLPSPLEQRFGKPKRFLGEEASNIDDALKKLAKAGEDFNNMREWARVLIKRFDKNMDGIISFQELCDGMRDMDINLALKDRVALMKKLDMNRDGEISDIELYRALSTVEQQLLKDTVDIALKKIASGGSDFSNLREYVKNLIKRFDGNNDGLISMNELSEGLKRMGIKLTNKEINALMEKLDLDKNGEIAQDELYKVLSGLDHSSSRLAAAGVSFSVDQAIRKLASGAETFSNMREYARFLIRQFDGNNDGIISFQELTDGLKSLGIQMNLQESQALMKKLDINRDGRITEDELYKIFSGSQAANDTIPSAMLPQIIDQALKKIASGADDFSDMKGYAKSLIRRFDRNQDGHIQFKELCEGLKTMNIFLTQKEREALMKKLDTNQDGSISDQELHRALASINIDSLKQMAKEQADIALKKIASGAEEFPNLREYVKFLIKKFDGNSDGIISFEELASGLKTLHINLTLKEKLALMKRLDLNRYGEITAEELYKVLSKVDIKFSKEQIEASLDQVLRKIASGADDFQSMKEYVRVLVTRFDKNGDGLISFDELCNGLGHFKIFLTSQERNSLMRRLDFNRDGEITIDELYNAVRPYENGAIQPNYSRYSSTVRHSPNISPDKVSFKQKELERITVEEIINKVKKGASKYQSYKHFVSAMMRRYDTDNDGYVNFKELSEGLKYDGINLTHEERLQLMKHLDVDCDGVISRDELFHALLLDSRHRRNHHHPKVNVEHLLRRIRQGAEKFKSLDAFVKYLFDKLDTDGSGALSFNELSEGLNNMGIEITHKEKHALMKKLDDDADGEIGYDEFYRGLAEAGKFKQPTELNTSQALNVDHALKKIAIGAEQYKCLEDYIIMLFKKFDVNKDGALSFKELREGLRSMNVHLADNEIHALFHLVDVDRDGEITQEELYNAVLSKEKYYKNPKIGQQKVNVDHVLNLIKKGVEKYSSLDAYVRALMERFDINGDGSISIDELGEGLKSINVHISDKEKLALMKELDKDRDGGISQQELYNALASNKGASTSRMSRAFSTSPVKLPGFNGQAMTGVDQILAKIRKAVAHYKSMQEQIIGLLRIFDLDNDGLISYLELVDGVKALGITAKKADMIDLMNRIDTDKDGFITQIELYKALDLKPQHEGYQGTTASIDQVLVKLRRGAEKYHNLTEYVNYLFQQYATSNSNYMTFQELMNCLKTFSFNLTQVERIALMKKMDENGDNQISKEEFYNALATAGQSSSERHSPRGGIQDSDEIRVDQALLKIKQGASKFRSLGEYVKYLIKKLDTNKDGYITYLELVEGLREMGIKVFKGEQAAMMRRLDEDKDGVISYDELLKALSRV